MREERALDQTFVIPEASVTFGTSTMYVLWLLRGGVLLGSYLSALPAWRLLDPLPVLPRVDDEEEEEDEEPLRSDERHDAPHTLRGFA